MNYTINEKQRALVEPYLAACSPEELLIFSEGLLAFLKECSGIKLDYLAFYKQEEVVSFLEPKIKFYLSEEGRLTAKDNILDLLSICDTLEAYLTLVREALKDLVKGVNLEF